MIFCNRLLARKKSLLAEWEYSDVFKSLPILLIIALQISLILRNEVAYLVDSELYDNTVMRLISYKNPKALTRNLTGIRRYEGDVEMAGSIWQENRPQSEIVYYLLTP